MKKNRILSAVEMERRSVLSELNRNAAILKFEGKVDEKTYQLILKENKRQHRKAST